MNVAVRPIQWLGARTLEVVVGVAEVFALLYGAIAVLAYVRTRGFRVVLEIGVAQTLFTGVHALGIVSLGSLAMGILIIQQANTYLPTVELASAVATQVLVRDVIPLMVGVILLGRSGTAICVKLAGMKLSGEIDALRSMGMPLEHVVVLPRLIAGAVSACVLVVYGVAVALAFGYTVTKAIGSLPFALEALINALETRDMIQALVKAFLFGASTVLVAVREGYSVQASAREIPQATTRAVVRCMAVMLVCNSFITIAF